MKSLIAHAEDNVVVGSFPLNSGESLLDVQVLMMLSV